MTRDEVITEARKYVTLRSRWRHKGRTATGMDCIGLLILTAAPFDVPIRDMADYSAHPTGKLLIHLRSHLVPRPGAAPKKAMIGVFHDQSQPCHVGIIGERYGRPSLIHASLERRGVVEENFDDRWNKALVELFDYPGVED